MFNNVQKTQPEGAQNKVIYVKATQFDLCNALYDSKLFSKIKLAPGTRLVLLAMARHYNPNKPDFYPSYACLSEHMGVSKKSVERAIKELVAKGLITYTTQKVNHYRFTSLFFCSVKMTIDERQNDDCNQRQNDAQTNNHEKRKKKDFSNNLFQKESSHAQNQASKALSTQQSHDIKDNQRPSRESFEEVKMPPAEKISHENSARSANPSALRTYKATADAPLEAYAYKILTQPTQNDRQRRNRAETNHAEDGGGRRIPSREETQRYLESRREARKNACLPTDFPPEKAIAWYFALAPQLRKLNLARSVAAKFGIEEDFVTEAIPLKLEESENA